MTSQMHDGTQKAPQSFETAAGTLIASAVLSAAGAWTRSASIIDVRGARRLTLLIDYTAAAAGGAGGFPEVVPLVAYDGLQPVNDAAVWYGLGVWGGTVTEAALTGTLPAGTDFSGAPFFAQCKHQALVISSSPAVNNSDRIQMAVSIDVTSARWAQIMAHEKGAAGSPGTLAVNYALGA